MAGNLFGYTVLSGLSLDRANASAVSSPVLSLNTHSFSILTASSATLLPNNSLGLVFRTSGISLVYYSGGTVYSFGSSGVGASFASGTV